MKCARSIHERQLRLRSHRAAMLKSVARGEFDPRDTFEDCQYGLKRCDALGNGLIAMPLFIRPKELMRCDSLPKRIIAQRVKPRAHIFNALKIIHGHRISNPMGFVQIWGDLT